MGDNKGKGKRPGPPQRENWSLVLCLEAFISLLQVGILGELAGEGFSTVFLICPGVPFQGVFGHCSGTWCHPPGFADFSGPGAETQRPRCYL